MSEQVESKQQDVPEVVAKAWQELPQFQEDARKFGADVDKATLGYAINYIIGDDINAFSSMLSYGDREKFDLNLSLSSKSYILARLNWESGLNQIPDELREKISVAKSTLEQSDWTGWDGFMGAYDAWVNNVRDYVLGKLEKDPDLKEAQTIFWDVEDKIKGRKLNRHILGSQPG